jgi:hypothetical protein
MNRCLQLACIALAAVVAIDVQAADIFWIGGAGNLTDPNYSDGVSNGLQPQEADILFLGNSGTVTHSVSGITLFQKIRVAQDLAAPGGVGPATLTVNNGAQLNLQLAGGGADASVIIGAGANIAGSGADGTLNIDGAGSSVISAQLVQIGFGGNAAANATVNITNGGALTATSGNINLGERAGNATTGIPGHLNISGTDSSLTIMAASADLNIGVRATSDYVQSDGNVSIGDQVNVGLNGTQNSTFSMTGGTLLNGGITVGANNAHNSSMSITGGTVTTKAGGVTLVGTNNAQNASLSIGGNAALTLGSNITVGDTTSAGATLTVADNATISIPGTASAGNIFIGRGTSSNATFNMTGGTITLGNHFLMGTATSPGATGVTGNQSAGSITTTNNFTIGDNFGASTYNLSGTATVNAGGWVIAGRQSTTGVINQTGGSLTAGAGVAVGRAENTNTALWGTGAYNVSGGTITANQSATSTALWIGSQGNGTFRVIGDDAAIDVNGNMVVNAGGGAQGTLGYQLEAGDLLTQIDVRDNATFSAGAILDFDTSLAAPTQTTYDVLTAFDIVDNGITFSGPAGWNYQIISGGNGEILQIIQSGTGATPGDFNSDGKVDAADYVTWRKNEVSNLPLPNDGGAADQAARFTLWRANFGNSPGSGSGLTNAAVPEPAAALLMLLGIAAAAIGRRRT